MTSIKVKFRSSSTDGKEGKLYLQIIHGRKVRQIQTEHRISKSEWDERKGNIKIVRHDQRAKRLTEINESISFEKERALWIANRLGTRFPDYTADDLVAEYHTYISRFSIFNFMSNEISDMIKRGKIGTAGSYKSALNSFIKLINDRNFVIDNLCPTTISDYEAYLKSKHLVPNTTSFYMRIMRAIYNRAGECGALIAHRNLFKNVYTGIDKTLKRAIPINSLQRIKNMDLSYSPSLDFARDMFMLSFFTRGMSFIDMAFTLKSDLQNGYLTYRRHKTGQTITLKWTNEMQLIIDKYPINTTDYLFPIIRNPRSNPRYAYRNAAYKINRDLKKVASLAGMSTHLTLYCARHSWATAAQTNGIPMNIISQGMGHGSESTTRIYLASIETSSVDRAKYMILHSLENQISESQ